MATAAHLMQQAGFAFTREPGLRRPVPVIMLSDAALALLRDVFGNAALFADKPRIDCRVVKWGSAEAVAMPHGAAIVSEDDLANVLDMFPRGNEPKASSAQPDRAKLNEPAASSAQADRAKLNIQHSNDFNADFAIHAMPPFPEAEMLRFGERLSATARVTLKADAPARTCWIEAVDAGWLFLIPDGYGQAWLLAVGGAPQALAQSAPLIGPLIESLEPAGGQFDTSPRMLAKLAGDGWLACGTAAIAFDPICGDGTAQAAREGILAAGVIGALARGEEPSELATHYHSLLLASLRRHLQLSLPFYANGGAGPWWHEQYAAAREGYDRTTALLSRLPEPRFALHGFDLIRRGQAA
ncbi:MULTISPECIES: hypothetical protein [unclassified Novosphingobium]|uniref:hypothetical protein n=1 Tax=unclassified Novosphingobium TaxID=2644732 RepID=UPI0025D350C3|nr:MULTISPECIES: hypothetical protein [unclassified Novosphingobium]HQS70192.1 hypothetical protein [Novosphingobium sp.]